jgi:copper chaperone CopZ
MSEQVYRVAGMSCEHCVAAVSDEVGRVPGAEHVEVDLTAGTLIVRGEVAADQVRDAVEEAGYTLV